MSMDDWTRAEAGHVSRVTEELWSSYHRSTIPFRPGCLRPDRGQVIELVRELRTALFPDFFPPPDGPISNPIQLEQHLEMLVVKLTRQIHDATPHPCPCSSDPRCPALAEARAHALTFVHHLPAIRELLELDIQAAYEGDPAATDLEEVILSYPGVFAVMVYRLAHQLHRQGVRLIPRMMTEYAHSRTGIDIHPGATIGKSFFIDHGTGVVIGETCVLGNGVKLYQGVTLGALSFPRGTDGQLVRHTKRHPTLEDEVTVYAGATILGGDTVIGHHSIIGGNVWITESVPPGSKVLSRPIIEVR